MKRHYGSAKLNLWPWEAEPFNSLYNDNVSCVISQKCPYETTDFSTYTLHFTTPGLLKSISYSLAHNNIALLLLAKLTPQVPLYLLTDIPSPASPLALEGRLIPLLSRKERQGGGMVRGKKLDWVEKKKNRESWGSYQASGEWVWGLTV